MTTTKPMLAQDGCTTHRDRCNFGHSHTWNLGGFIETDEDGHLVRIGSGPYRRDLMWCDRCNQLCYLVEN